MPLTFRIESAIDGALARAGGGAPPPRLTSALHHAVKPGGARIRPTISLSVALACGDDDPGTADRAAAAIELIHCASLVHDDLPCFDDAAIRRGKLTVHRAYSEPLAVLAGDSLIILAFEELSRATPARGLPLVAELARFTGMPHGICAGQGWESEDEIDLATYHRAKTGALFTAATRMGAIAAGHDPEPWTELGARIGEAFQVADDLLDATQTEMQTGKPMGQDALHDRPSAVGQLGIPGAIRRLEDILSGAIASIPACPGEAMLAAMVRKTAERLTPVHHRTPAE
ncbi:polyprenyl synthetase family protein [Jannaschia aquimarina]|uniref:Geranylgeranyl diphosphate synthase n=1 Tax=Jannaschia aquimarina TaxID=935700 RepID=A0A0D1EGD9_9RHOB|nr:polyprenyl synthetase family protein [Jannaschia aquimarina]KIT14910.1 Farnesyl diphosphate synthase [Jannaschia aquimarina]SNS59088.1 farnesyl-diphosphate synthase [Jannaschia aquimarina]